MYPPAGTLLSSNCSGNASHDGGATDYFDAYGTQFNGMFTLWQEFADGAGGSYWTNGDNSSNGTTSCWLPEYFYLYSNPGEATLEWSGCGSSGSFAYGQNYDWAYSNGDGTSTSSQGTTSYGYPYGYTIYDNGSGCCYVYYDGDVGYYVSDTCESCPEYGSFAYDGCNNVGGTDASGQYYDGTWEYGNFYNDGNCGYYFSISGEDTNGCYHPYGWFFIYDPYSAELYWEVTSVYDGMDVVANGYFNYSGGWNGTRADGSGGTYNDSNSWSAASGDIIWQGTYFDNHDSSTWYATVTYDGNGGYSVSQDIYNP